MKSFQDYLNAVGEYGVAEQVRYPLVFASGLPKASLGEVVVFESGQRGYIVALKPSSVFISLLDAEAPAPGSRVTRTGRDLHVRVGAGQRGKIIDPLGNPFIPGEVLEGEFEERPVDTAPLPIERRRGVSKQLVTGISIVDLLVPLASGQREAVIGDQKTGKKSFMLAAAKTHAETGIVVYALIGKTWSEIRQVYNYVQEVMKQENVIIVATAAEAVPSLITVTPYAAMTIAEYWRDAGHDVLLILHDLSTHAQYHREVSLLAEQFPGRESYPGEMFYAHARLLERAGNFTGTGDKHNSITCLAVAETVHGNISSYIVSNLISITDGHLLFDAVKHSEGQRPAVDTAASVTRVGRHVHLPVAKELNLKLTALLSQYTRGQQFARFGSEMSQDLRDVLTVCDRLVDFFAQPPFLSVPLSVQVVMATMIWQGWLNDQPVSATSQMRDRLIQHYSYDKKTKTLIDRIAGAESLDDMLPRLKRSKAAIMKLCQTATLSAKS